ncbi:hypothetical protein ACTXT7_014425 [Hymenolepis weldensis]
MEPHLDRVFNFLIAHIYDKDIEKPTLTSSAELIVNSIVPGSNVLRLLQNFFRVCLWDYPEDNEEAVKANLPFFCFQVILSFCKRVNFEFTWIPEVKEYIGEIIEWARLTKQQVDEFVKLLLPICFEDIFFCGDQDSVCGAVQTLVLLRPRLVIPHVIESIEEGYLTPQFPLKLTKSLKILGSCASLFVCPNVFPIWNYYIGLQPTDQLQNFALDDISRAKKAVGIEFLCNDLPRMSHANTKNLENLSGCPRFESETSPSCKYEHSLLYM